MGGGAVGATEAFDEVVLGVGVAHEAGPDVAAAAGFGSDVVEGSGPDGAALEGTFAEADSDDGSDEDFEYDECRDRVGRKEEYRDFFIAEQAESLDGSGVHGYPGGVEFAEVGEDFPDGGGSRATYRAGDDDEFAAQHLGFDDFFEAAGFTGGDAYPVDVCAGGAAGGGEGVGVNVEDLAE